MKEELSSIQCGTTQPLKSAYVNGVTTPNQGSDCVQYVPPYFRHAMVSGMGRSELSPYHQEQLMIRNMSRQYHDSFYFQVGSIQPTRR